MRLKRSTRTVETAFKLFSQKVFATTQSFRSTYAACTIESPFGTILLILPRQTPIVLPVVTGCRARRYSYQVDRDEIIRVLRAFEARGLKYVLIGAAAMGFHGIVRATEDLDLFIQATPENVERLRAAFRDVYDNDPHIEDISSTDLLGEYPAIRYYPPTGDIYFDLLTRLGESAQFEDVEVEIKEIEGTRVKVATPAALYRLKKGTIRVQDRLDAAALRERFNLKDES